MNKSNHHPYLSINSNGAIICTDDMITKAVIPEYVNDTKVTSIGWDAFGCCESLKEITIPNSVTYIDGCAFFNCISLTKIVIPNSVTKVGGNAFFCCKSLKVIYIDKEKCSLDLKNAGIPDTTIVKWKGDF